jgi:hypothetical protein
MSGQVVVGKSNLMRSDIGEVIKTIVDDEAFPDYAMPKKTIGRKKRKR